MSKPDEETIAATMLRLLRKRGTATACPSEIARLLSDDEGTWRGLMPAVRKVAAKLMVQGLVDAYQHGSPVDPSKARGPIRLRLRESASIDYRKHPERYRIGRGEEGVLTVEPYKSELLPLWRFRTPDVAKTSAAALWKAFLAYGREGDFVGMDMARKFLQMGWTRARRYANHRTGRKYAPGERRLLPKDEDPEKAQSAAIFHEYYQRALKHRRYQALREAHRARTSEEAKDP